jgi:hypothetical protein
MDRTSRHAMERLMSSGREDQRLGRGAPLGRAALEAQVPGIGSSVSGPEMGSDERTDLLFLGLDLFVKFVGFVLEMSQHCLETRQSIHRARGRLHYRLTLSERQAMPLCFKIFFIAIGLPPKPFISFSSQITYSSSVPT